MTILCGSGPTVILLMGPTASGKSVLAMELAERLPLEVVSVDSAQVYRGMDIGTAKPSPAERAAVPHHLIDILEPTEAYSAGRFREHALHAVRDIAARGRLPLLAGGTMLYFKALREGLSVLPQADAQLRSQIDAEAARCGWPALHAKLATIDPQTAARLGPNDAQRIQRALEVHELAGAPLSRLLAEGGRNALPFRSFAIALVPGERAVLHRRIEARFDAMLKAGLADELRGLRSRYELSPRMPAMRAVGYRQAWQYLDGEINAAELRERGICATRQLAKRQLTWLHSMPDAITLDCLAPGLSGKALDQIGHALEAH